MKQNDFLVDAILAIGIVSAIWHAILHAWKWTLHTWHYLLATLTWHALAWVGGLAGSLLVAFLIRLFQRRFSS